MEWMTSIQYLGIRCQHLKLTVNFFLKIFEVFLAYVLSLTKYKIIKLNLN
jgi:hypothetical protein